MFLVLFTSVVACIPVWFISYRVGFRCGARDMANWHIEKMKNKVKEAERFMEDRKDEQCRYIARIREVAMESGVDFSKIDKEDEDQRRRDAEFAKMMHNTLLQQQGAYGLFSGLQGQWWG